MEICRTFMPPYIRNLARKYSKPERPVKDKDGHPISDLEGQKKRWVEHFEELLNRPAPPDPPDVQPADSDLTIDCNTPTKEEIQNAIKQLRKGKAAGPDNISAEALKADIRTNVELLYPLFNKIWDEKQVPTEWKEGYLIKLPKKGDLSSCSNYRGITLLPIPGKVFNRVLLNRIKDAIDPQLREQQAGFRKNRSCTDQIAMLRIILEQSLEWNSPLYINFVDYEKAFDSVDRQTLWKLLRHYGIPEKITNIIRNSYEGMTCRVVHGRQLTDAFEVRTGVRQGCLLSPFMFLLTMDWVMKTSTAQGRNGIQWTPWKQLDDLDYADQRGKSKVLKVNTVTDTPIMLEGEALDEVESFTYLGSIADNTGGTEADVRARIGKARAAFQQLKNVWRSSLLGTSIKIRIFNTIVKPVLLYGAETWRTTVATMKRFRLSLTPASEGFLRLYAGQTSSATKICGNERDSSL